MPAPGSKYTAPLNRPGPKTGRRYGAVVSAIRSQLSQKGQGGSLTKQDFAPINAAQASDALKHLAKRGEVQIVKPGQPGRHPHPAIYSPKP